MTDHTAQPTMDYVAAVNALTEAREAGKEYLPIELQKQVSQSLRAVDERLALGVHHTIVALAGGTGSGKSSTFNAISGLEFADVGVRRPTTARLASCSWNSTATALLDWLEVDHDRRIFRDTALDGDEQREFDGLILLDLPDHDSVAEHHRLIVDKVLPLVDLLIWIVDPQKYADAALHAGYLRQLVGQETSMLVVLNQADKLTADEQLTITTDLGRLLHDDGVGDVVIRTISARTGDGVEDLRDDIQRAVAAQSMAARRLDEELGRIARLMRSATPSGAIEDLSLTTSQEIDRFAVAAGVDTVKDTIESATLADRATGTPPTFGAPHQSAVDNLRHSWIERVTEPLRGGFYTAAREAAGTAQQLHDALVASCASVTIPWGPVSGARTMRTATIAAMAAGALVAIAGILFTVFSPVALGVTLMALGVVISAGGYYGWRSLKKKIRYEATERAQAFDEDARRAIGVAITEVLFVPVQPVLDVHHTIRRTTRTVEKATRTDIPKAAHRDAHPQGELPRRTT